MMKIVLPTPHPSNADFGFTKVTVERPLRQRISHTESKGSGQASRQSVSFDFVQRDPSIVCDKKGRPKPDSKLRDYEKVPLKEDIVTYFERGVKPHVSDAWLDRNKDKVGYEINFSKYFYTYTTDSWRLLDHRRQALSCSIPQ